MMHNFCLNCYDKFLSKLSLQCTYLTQTSQYNLHYSRQMFTLAAQFSVFQVWNYSEMFGISVKI
jgi:hypothetical protein